MISLHAIPDGGQNISENLTLHLAINVPIHLNNIVDGHSGLLVISLNKNISIRTRIVFFVHFKFMLMHQLYLLFSNFFFSLNKDLTERNKKLEGEMIVSELELNLPNVELFYQLSYQMKYCKEKKIFIGYKLKVLLFYLENIFAL